MQRFWDKVIKTETCWLWDAAVFKDTGYGAFKLDGYQRQAHRVSWELTYGEIPSGMLVLHHCDVKLCVRPDHLFLGTQADNMRDMIDKGRHENGDRLRKLSDAQHTEIQLLLEDGFSAGEVARAYGVHRTTVSRLR